MKATLKWFPTGRRFVIEDSDTILSPDTTIAELKGLIQIQFGFPSEELLLMSDHSLENTATLRSLGIMGEPLDPILKVYVARESALEIGDPDEDDTTNDDVLQEFSHADFTRAMEMLGKRVPVPDDRIVAMRHNAPRQRPAFLDTRRESEDGAVDHERAPQLPPGMPGVVGRDISIYDPKSTEVHQIVSRGKHGLSKEGVDAELAVCYPGVDEPFPLWGIRTPDPLSCIDGLCSPGEVCLELFYFGELDAVEDEAGFLLVVQQSLRSKTGVSLRKLLPLRKAGCMYPLIAVPIVLHEMDAMVLGDVFFEDFGKVGSARPFKCTGDGAKVAGSGGPGCTTQ